jgi:hypothetical protein
VKLAGDADNVKGVRRVYDCCNIVDKELSIMSFSTDSDAVVLETLPISFHLLVVDKVVSDWHKVNSATIKEQT